MLSNVRALERRHCCARRLRIRPGDVYNAEAVEKTVEEMTIEAAKRGYAFATVRPRGDRKYRDATDQPRLRGRGGRARLHRAHQCPRQHPHARLRDPARIRYRPKAIAYNRALISRAERRLKNLGYFKTVKITTEPGSAPDRVIINVDVEEQSTGEFSVAGGYSTADGFLAEVSVAERNLLGRGQYAKAAVQYGQNARGFSCRSSSPISWAIGWRSASTCSPECRCRRTSSPTTTRTIGGGFRFGFPLREDLALQLRYSIYQQEIELPFSCGTATTQSEQRRTLAHIRPAFPAAIDPHTGMPFTQTAIRRRGLAGGQAANWREVRCSPRWSARPVLQYARQQPKSDQRPARRVQAGFRRRRRRRQFHPHPPPMCAPTTK